MIVKPILPNRARSVGPIAGVVGLLALCANRARRPAFPVSLLVAMTICASLGSQTFAADRSYNDRSVAGPVVPGSGTTAGSGISPRKRTSPLSPFNASSLRGAGQPDERCAALRKRYAQSEACFAHYRMKNHGLRPGAFQRCKQLKDPSWECGSAVVP
jgi:hypothetical protein